MGTLTKKTFLEEVRAEIETIKARATKEEIDRLDLQTFHPSRTSNCIYGQMTGDCDSERAVELMAKKYEDIGALGSQSFTDLKKWGHFEENENFTPLEVYITMKGAKPENVIAYLKGEAETLKL